MLKEIRGYRICLLLLFFLLTGLTVKAKTTVESNSPVAYDIDMAKEILDKKALDPLEGIWIYPDDKVSVMICRQEKHDSKISFPKYDIRVIESEDCRLSPGDLIGMLESTPTSGQYKIELFTEKKKESLIKPQSILATLSKEEDALTIKKEQPPLKTRLNLNFNRLLSGFWKIVSIGLSKNSQNVHPSTGMIKIYPSYDGNGSSRRSPRYL